MKTVSEGMGTVSVTDTYQLSQEEYREFLHWYKREFKGKAGSFRLSRQGSVKMEEDWLTIHSGSQTIQLLYSSVEKIRETENLLVFFDMKSFWAIPKRALGGGPAAAEFRWELEARYKADKQKRFSFRELEDKYQEEGGQYFRYVRSVDDVTEACMALGCSKQRMKKLRKNNLFPYRLVGEQMLAVGKEKLYEHSERALEIHDFREFTRAFYTEENLYLMKDDKQGLIIPLAVVGGLSGAESLAAVCSQGREESDKLRLKPVKVPVWYSWEIPWKPVAAVTAVATAAAVVGLFIGLVSRMHLQFSVPAQWSDRGGMEANQNQRTDRTRTRETPFDLLVTVADDTKFDQVQEDGTFVSSNLFYTVKLPDEGWTVSQDTANSMDILSSDWGDIRIRSERMVYMEGFDAISMIPKTKSAYKKNIGNGMKIDVIDYSYEDDGEYVVVKKETRLNFDTVRYSLDQTLWSEKNMSSISVTLARETPEAIAAAKEILDSFRLLDTSAGICKEMANQVFEGDYGRNLFMTRCLVLMEREMDTEEIATGLEQLKKLKGGMFSGECDTLALRTPDSQWLGIDCGTLQQNCTKEMARKVSGIFKAPVILYDEYDGDLLMVAYSDSKQKMVYQHATSHNKWVLEQEFRCYGKEQQLPDFLLDYLDISKKEAEAIWKSEDYVFQIEKWYDLTRHMTKMPMPEEFTGLYEIQDLGEEFEIIRE